MHIETIKANGTDIAVVSGDGALITDVQSALDVMATVSYEAGCYHIIMEKSSFSEPFFDLKTKLAGDILQKFMNYRIKLAIVGDYSQYSSKSLKDFIYECNQGNDLLFVSDAQQAVDRWSR